MKLTDELEALENLFSAISSATELNIQSDKNMINRHTFWTK